MTKEELQKHVDDLSELYETAKEFERLQQDEADKANSLCNKIYEKLYWASEDLRKWPKP